MDPAAQARFAQFEDYAKQRKSEANARYREKVKVGGQLRA